MLHPWLAMVTRREKLNSPIGYVKESIFFTFVLLWIKLPKFWKTLQLLNPNSWLVIRSFLLTLSQLVMILAWIHLLPILIFLSMTLLCLFPTNHWSKRVSTWLFLHLFTLLPKRVVIILLMFFSSPQINMNRRVALFSQLFRRVLLLFL
jgi:hypothetical protein